MPAIWAAAIGGAVSLYSGAKASKAAKGQQAVQAAAQDKQAANAADQLAFGKEQYADFRGKFDPLYDDVRNMAYEERNPDFAQLQADTGAAMDAGQGAERRNMARYGMNPSDGAWGTSERAYGTARGAAVADGANRVRRGEKDARFSRIAGLSGMLNPIANMASNAIGSGYAGISGAYGDQAATAGANAAQSRSDASASYNAAGQAIGAGVSAYGSRSMGASTNNQMLSSQSRTNSNISNNVNWNVSLPSSVPSYTQRNVPMPGPTG